MGDLSARLADLPPTPFLVLPATELTAEARRRLPPDRVLLVVDRAARRPLGLLTPPLLAELPDAAQPLATWRDFYEPVLLSEAGCPLSRILPIWTYERRLSWPLLTAGGAVLSIIRPETILSRLPNRDELVKTLRLESLTGNPVAPPLGLCYRCPHEPEHDVPPEWVERHTVDGDALCPCHNTVMQASTLCPQEYPPC